MEKLKLNADSLLNIELFNLCPHSALILIVYLNGEMKFLHNKT